MLLKLVQYALYNINFFLKISRSLLIYLVIFQGVNVSNITFFYSDHCTYLSTDLEIESIANDIVLKMRMKLNKMYGFEIVRGWINNRKMKKKTVKERRYIYGINEYMTVMYLNLYIKPSKQCSFDLFISKLIMIFLLLLFLNHVTY